MKKYWLLLALSSAAIYSMDKRTPEKMFLDEANDLIEEFQEGKIRDFSILEGLLAEEPVINAQDKRGNSALHYAAWHGDAVLAAHLLEWEELDTKSLNSHNSTPLILAAYQASIADDYTGHEKVILALLNDTSIDPHINARNNSGYSAVDYLNPQKHKKSYEALIRAGAQRQKK